jgi:Domain of unknown function (DUF4349)
MIMKKIGYGLCLALALSACGKKSEDAVSDAMGETTSNATATVEAAAGTANNTSGDSTAEAPSIDGATAPGVAFDFRYTFSIPGENIASVQEDHAQSCKKLGLDKCQITDLDYSANGDDVSAMMAFKITPDIAPDFARDARKAAEKADGKLTNANLDGTDVGTGIAAGEEEAQSVQSELARIDGQLKSQTLTKQARSTLVEKAETLRAELRSTKAAVTEGKAKLAMTPVVFDYQTRSTIAGIDSNSEFGSAFSLSLSSFMTMLQLLIVMLGVAAPWVIVIGGGVFAVRYFKRKNKTVVAE